MPLAVSETSVLIQFLDSSLTSRGSELIIPSNTTNLELSEILNQQQTSKEPEVSSLFNFSLYHNSQEIPIYTSLLDTISSIGKGISSEIAIQLIAHPLSETKVRPVTRCTASLAGHTEAVLVARFSPSSHTLATGSGDGTVRLWDLLTATPAAVLSGHTGWVLTVEWSPCGQSLASAGTDKTVIIWNKDGKKILTLGNGHIQPVTCLAWKPDSSAVVAGSKDGRLVVHENIGANKSSVVTRTLNSAHSAPCTQVRWLSNGEIISTGRDRLVKVFDGSRLVLKEDLKGHAHWINTLALSCKDGQATRMLTGSDDFTMILWQKEFQGWKLLARLTGHQKIVNHVCFSPDGRWIASASFDRSIKVWSAITGDFMFNLRGHVGEVYMLSWSADSRMLVSGSKDSTVKVWDVLNRKLKEDLPGHADEVFAVDWSTDGKWVASAGRDKIVKIWGH
jgi:ribosome assembly protein 4